MLKTWILLVSCCLQASRSAWINSYDKVLNFECPDGAYISTILSKHDNHYDDRRFDFKCSSGYVGNDCSWSGYKNSYDKTLHYVCPGNTIVTGLHSVHDNYYNDRKWKIRCCGINTKPGLRCKWTAYINNYDGEMDKKIEGNKAIIGLYSVHNNYYNDRRFKLKLCDFATCNADKITVLDDVKPTYAGERIVGIATMAVCSASASPQISMASTDSVEESASFTVTKGKDFTFNTEISVGAEASAGFLGSGATMTFGVAQSFGGVVHAETSNTKDTTVGTSNTAASTIGFTSPGAALLMAVVKKYKFNREDINTEVSIVCDDGERFTRRQVMTLTSTTYGRTHFKQEVGMFLPNECDDSKKFCIGQIKGDHALDSDALKKEFRACFQNGEQFNG